MNRHILIFFVYAVIFPATTFGVVETYQFSDLELEQRYRQLSSELRCPKCQNQNIAESNAPISKDLRRVLYEKLEAGSSDKEILDHMAVRYGEFVRYRPVFARETVLLWIAPIIFLFSGIGSLWLVSKRVSNVRNQVEILRIDEEFESLLAEDDSRS